MASVVVFDIDGVLADVRHRLHFVSSRPKNWRAFFAAAAEDGELRAGTDLLRSLQADHEIRYLTGRPERLRAVTRQWLAQYGLPTDPLAMRPHRDFRPSRVFKRDQLQQWLDAGAVIEVVVDDDPQVIAMVEGLGLRVIAADWQESAPLEQKALRAAQEDEGRT